MPKKARPRAGAAPAPRPEPVRRPRALRWAVLAVFLVLCGTAEERTFGTISDEQQMLHTATSMAWFGEIGIARGQFFAIHRPAGDAVAPYGMGLPLLEVPLVLAAGSWEKAFGARSSQTLFVLLQILLVTAASAGAGLLARQLGVPPSGEALAAVATGLGSPLWGAIESGLSEPLQAAVSVFAVLGAARAAALPASRTRWAVLAGALTGYALLIKGLNVALGPVLLLPLALDGELAWKDRLRLVGLAAAGAVLPFCAWLAFEFVRFGSPLSSYSGQAFTHPFLDGLWRLLVGANKGLLLYFPLLPLSVLGAAALLRRRESRGTALAAAGTLGALLLVSASWWAWDGTGGWGPRFLLPALPLLAALAAAALASRPALRPLAFGLLAAGMAVNALGALQSSWAALTLLQATPAVKGTARDVERFPPYHVTVSPSGEMELSRIFVSGVDAAYAPIRLHAYLLWSRLTAGDEIELRQRLRSPPWLRAHPEAVPELDPPPATNNAILLDLLKSPFRWPHLFRATLADGAERTRYAAAYDVAIADQALRNLDLGRPEQALRAARRFHELAPSGYSAALVLEALRMGRRDDEYAALRAGLSPREAGSPFVLLVEALRARDQGAPEPARRLLSAAASRMRNPRLLAALAQPPEAWPRGYRELTTDLLERAQTVERPGQRWVP